MSATLVAVIVAAVILGLVSLGSGIYCIVRYARSRKVVTLIVGLILTLIVPGIFLCVALGAFIPSTMIVYGPPPPPTTIVYGPPPTSIP
jgi:nicotinamide riboside transporter PnuC